MVKISLSLDTKAEYDLMMSALHNDMAFATAIADGKQAAADGETRGHAKLRASNLDKLIKKLS